MNWSHLPCYSIWREESQTYERVSGGKQAARWEVARWPDSRPADLGHPRNKTYGVRRSDPSRPARAHVLSTLQRARDSLADFLPLHRGEYGDAISTWGNLPQH